ncbi:hypothetical protein BDV33DRAFT_184903 [Aspergillus novoparasiticus]|uniref:Uncharacterized protein n=1 Tax=Aspergillus novoparasiticus TaxID=986946 RepID=A0A5N6E7Q5_9EURO|nr:hypothetical protein BDV33DRAFT_184903 [Aspergillus novoparasiticus]
MRWLVGGAKSRDGIPSPVIRVVLGLGGMGGEQSSSESSCRAWVNKKPYDNLSCRRMIARLVDWPRVVVVIGIAKT